MRASLGLELGTLLCFPLFLSDFGTCIDITIQLYINYGTLNYVLNFLAFGNNNIATFKFIFLYLFI